MFYGTTCCSKGTLTICLTHASRTLFSGSWAEEKEASGSAGFIRVKALQKFYTKAIYSYPHVVAFAFPTSPLGIKKTEDPRVQASGLLRDLGSQQEMRRIEADLKLNKDGPLAARGLISFTEA
ncbi:hypothetical protein L1987_39268 [Smallanthus sonchifolius]|uniref:Uncharacterized protein n=1 Tax=Smallanthus sonchifolius TaxID=185202 RepID=A0ACB9HLJ6_9ASTR|nr:hypothetical protein L1987_39268 [Smallanthus sonchifolius]